MKFIVKRSKWYRGFGGSTSKLLRADGTRCCIGFVGEQCGIPDSDLLSRSAVRNGGFLSSDFQKFPEWMQVPTTALEPSPAIYRAYSVNDDPNISDAVREEKLKEIFLSQGDEIEFVY